MLGTSRVPTRRAGIRWTWGASSLLLVSRCVVVLIQLSGSKNITCLTVAMVKIGRQSSTAVFSLEPKISTKCHGQVQEHGSSEICEDSPELLKGAVTGRFGVAVARPSDGAVPSGPLLVVDVPYSNRKCSSVSGKKKMGEGYGRGMLTDSEGWRAGANDYGQSYTMDLGETKSVAGVLPKV